MGRTRFVYKRPELAGTIVAFFGLLLGGPAFAAAEERCSALGSSCVCSEPLQSNTHGGGKPYLSSYPGPYTFPGYDPDDSPNDTECTDSRNIALINFWYNPPTPGVKVVPASQEPLPPGHRLSNVMSADHEVHILHQNPVTSALPDGLTFCTRVYSRHERHHTRGNCGFLGSDGSYDNHGFRIATIVMNGSVQITSGSGGPVCENDPARGHFYHRDDSSPWSSGRSATDTSHPASWYAPTLGWGSCIDNYCRFEVCVDLRNDGAQRSRIRIATLPSPRASAWPVKTEEHASDWSTAKSVSWPASPISIFHPYNAKNGDAHNNNVKPRRYFAFGMAAQKRGMDPNFWIGPACEVEGGCTGAAPPPSPPPPSAGEVPAAPIILP